MLDPERDNQNEEGEETMSRHKPQATEWAKEWWRSKHPAGSFPEDYLPMISTIASLESSGVMDQIGAREGSDFARRCATCPSVLYVFYDTELGELCRECFSEEQAIARMEARAKSQGFSVSNSKRARIAGVKG